MVVPGCPCEGRCGLGCGTSWNTRCITRDRSHFSCICAASRHRSSRLCFLRVFDQTRDRSLPHRLPDHRREYRPRQSLAMHQMWSTVRQQEPNPLLLGCFTRSTLRSKTTRDAPPLRSILGRGAIARAGGGSAGKNAHRVPGADIVCRLDDPTRLSTRASRTRPAARESVFL